MKLKHRVISAVLCLYVAFSAMPAFAASQSDVSLTPCADTYTSSAKNSANYSVENSLKVSARAEDVKKSYISFQAGALPEGNIRVLLKLTPTKISFGTKEGKIALYGLKTHNWRQAKVTASAAPAAGSKLFELALIQNEVCEVDVTSYVKSNIDSRGYISFMLSETEDTGSEFEFASMESSKGTPELYIETNYVPPEADKPVTSQPTAAPDYNEVHKSEANTNSVPYPDMSLVNDETDIAKWTTTRVSPYMVNWHQTDPSQLAYNRKGGEAGQIFYSVAVSPKNPDKVLIGSDCQVVYRSEDGGENFVSSADGLKNYGVQYLSFYPEDENIAFAYSNLSAAGNATKVNNNVGIYKTYDGGKTWTQKTVSKIYRRTTMNAMVYGAKNKDGIRPIFAAIHGGGILRSDDIGENWYSIGLDDKDLYHLDMKGNCIAVAAGRDGVWITRNYGESWEQKVKGIEGETIRGVTINPLDHNYWICNTTQKVYVSRDAGENWELLTDRHAIKSNQLTAVLFGYPDENNNVRLFLTTNTNQYVVRYSDDWGKTFNRPVVDNSKYASTEKWGYYSKGFTLVEGYPNLVFAILGTVARSFDGGKTFHHVAGGVSGIRATNFLFSEENPSEIFISAIDHGIVKGIPYKDEWYPLSYIEPMESGNITTVKTSYGLARDPKNYNRLLCTMGSWSGRHTMYESLDNGLNWKIRDDMGQAFTTDQIFFHPTREGLIYCGDYKSTDNGVTWKKLPRAVKWMAPSNGDIVYAISSGVVYISQDCGESFDRFYSGTIDGPQRMIVDIENPYKIYVGRFAGGFYIIENGVARSIGKQNGLTPSRAGVVSAFTIAQNPNNLKHLICGGCDNGNFSPGPGIFESFDGGESWRLIEMPPPADVWIVQFHPSRPQVFIGTSGGTYVYEYENYCERPKSYFADIEGHFCEESVTYLREKGFFDEYYEFDYNVDKTMQEGEFLRFIITPLGLKRVRQDVIFDDENYDDDYYGTVQTGLENGLIHITDAKEGKLEIAKTLTHKKLAVYLVRLMNMYGVDTAVSSEEINSVKAMNMSVETANALAVLKKHSVITEEDLFEFNPDKAATKGEMAVMLAGTLKLFQ